MRAGPGESTSTILGTSLAVPAQDAADNVDVADVVGNKTDTSGGDSLVALTKATSDRHAVPAQDSADNALVRDVVGNKTDTHSANSIYGKVKQLLEHVHKPGNVYPTLATGVTLTASNAAPWTLGTVVEIVPASTIADDFDVHHISVEGLSANAVYEIVLYYGAGDTECGRVRVTKNAVQDGTVNAPMMTPLIPANSRVRAAVASDTGAADTAVISLYYHTY